MNQKSATWKTRETLLKKLTDQHDEKSWEEFISHYRRYLYTIVRRLNFNKTDTDDIIQLVIIRAWKKLPEFEYDPGKGKFRGWLFRLTLNEARMFIRKNSKHSRTRLDEHYDDIRSNLHPSNLPSIESMAITEWKNYISGMAWKNIEDHFQDQVKKSFLLFTKGGSAPDIAKQLGIAESSVYVYKKRVQDALCREIAKLDKQLC